jgi:ubiquinone/menaquinone biosynthesis C-methylase UbiE
MRWADLGCGDGTFTRALARLLPKESVIHAMDVDAAALRRIPREHGGVSIVAHAGSFLALPWPVDTLDGVLLANSLHYVSDQASFIRSCAPAMNSSGRLLIVEYDTGVANSWVPYPLNRDALRELLNDAGYRSVTFLGSRRSRYQRAGMYSAMASRS